MTVCLVFWGASENRARSILSHIRPSADVYLFMSDRCLGRTSLRVVYLKFVGAKIILQQKWRMCT